MEILGVGIPELTFIIIIAIIILGPKDMVSAGRNLGRLMRKLILSPEWAAIRKTGDEITRLPNRLMREAMLEDLQKEIEDPLKAANISSRKVDGDSNSILPPIPQVESEPKADPEQK